MVVLDLISIFVEEHRNDVIQVYIETDDQKTLIANLSTEIPNVKICVEISNTFTLSMFGDCIVHLSGWLADDLEKPITTFPLPDKQQKKKKHNRSSSSSNSSSNSSSSSSSSDSSSSPPTSSANSTSGKLTLSLNDSYEAMGISKKRRRVLKTPLKPTKHQKKSSKGKKKKKKHKKH